MGHGVIVRQALGFEDLERSEHDMITLVKVALYTTSRKEAYISVIPATQRRYATLAAACVATFFSVHDADLLQLRQELGLSLTRRVSLRLDWYPA